MTSSSPDETDAKTHGDSAPSDAHEAARKALNESPYSQALGIEVESIDDAGARLVLPFAEINSNPGGILHGGCAASLAAVGSHAVARAVLADDSGPWVIGQLQVNYLSAAVAADVIAKARLLRRGRSLCFVAIDITTRDGKAIGTALATVRARFDHPQAELPTTFGDAGESDPGPLAPFIEQQPFIAARGMHIENMSNSRARISMPASKANSDGDGRVHEGAILALLDTTGAMAAWAETGPGKFKASTASIQIQTLAPPPTGDLIAYGRCIHRDREMLWSDAEVVDAATGRVTTRGTVFYRLAS